MKKNLIIALALVAGASLSTVDAAKKKKVVVVEQAPVVETFSLNSASDSVSYAAGMSATQGLVEYLLQQKVDTAYMADFLCGFKETVVKDANNPKVKAYLMGTSIAQQLKERMLPQLAAEFKDTPDSISANVFYKGFVAGLLKDETFFKSSDANALVRSKSEAAKAEREERLYGANRRAGEEFLKENAKKEGVIVLPSGLQYKVLKQGTGAVPSLNDKVQVHYEGRLIDGTVFDASKKHGDEPTEFRPTDVIKGWTEALTMMPVGSKWQVYIPYGIAYGSREAGQIKPYSALVFDIELVGIVGDKPATTKNTKTQKKAKK
ncbi:FKBP-type peptidyl-prolyl cis-trans isomerase [Xylanibacter ruminicola]|uniref:Peptidyl-prolyl cis-trans isomerase n=1 Tax=Xylanibacter ruminicola TaxID=839 RepID=A0A1M6RV39_XYLRU|nr:FKBP-type peptidyl-prolyl cis-trans isomerase [Xylanibacter ruminicola]SHK36228.1 FKBP-type peptidyl-prolyl cis-trans isomerase FklB [Xylanibacter ruminicola]